jgi:hypothetical protein
VVGERTAIGARTVHQASILRRVSSCGHRESPPSPFVFVSERGAPFMVAGSLQGLLKGLIGWLLRPASAPRQRVEQRFGFLQIERIEPSVNQP